MKRWDSLPDKFGLYWFEGMLIRDAVPQSVFLWVDYSVTGRMCSFGGLVVRPEQLAGTWWGPVDPRDIKMIAVIDKQHLAATYGKLEAHP